MLLMIARLTIYLIVISALLTCVEPALADTKSSSFSYDRNGRLTTGLYEGAGRCVVWAYDANGNRTSQYSAVKIVAPPLWGEAKWGEADWVKGFANPLWGSATWGCVVWVPAP
jgi:hypothetical protein